jgi:excisionase family DNA binding protein
MKRKTNQTAREFVLTIPEAARLLRISAGTAYLAAKAGSLPVVKIGGSLRVPRARLEVLLGLKPQDDGQRVVREDVQP